MSRRASSSRSRFWYWSGVIDVMALNRRWNADGLSRAISASSSHADGLGEAVAEGVERARHGARPLVGDGEGGDLGPVRAGQEPVADLAFEGREQERDRVGRVEQADGPEDAVREGVVDREHEHAGPTGAPARGRRAETAKHVGDGAGVEPDDDAEVGGLRARVCDDADGRDVDGHDERLASPVLVGRPADGRLLRALHDDAERRLVEEVPGVLPLGRAEEDEAVDGGLEGAVAGPVAVVRVGVALDGLGQPVRHGRGGVGGGRNRQECSGFRYSARGPVAVSW